LEAAEAIAEAAIQAALRVDKEVMAATGVAVTQAVVMVVTAALEVMVDTAVTAVMGALEVMVAMGVVPEEGMAVMEVVIQAVALEVGMEVMAATAVAVTQAVASVVVMVATVAVTQATGAFTKTFLSAIRIRLRHSKRQLVVRRRFRGMGVRHFPALLFLNVNSRVVGVDRVGYLIVKCGISLQGVIFNQVRGRQRLCQELACLLGL
jgi:hypothetical protein